MKDVWKLHSFKNAAQMLKYNDWNLWRAVEEKVIEDRKLWQKFFRGVSKLCDYDMGSCSLLCQSRPPHSREGFFIAYPISP